MLHIFWRSGRAEGKRRRDTHRRLDIEHKTGRKKDAEIKSEHLLYGGKPVLSHSDRELKLYRDDGKEFTYPFGGSRSALATEADERLYYRELLATFSSEGDATSHAYRFDQLSDGQRALLVLYSLVFETIPDAGSPGDSADISRTLFLDEPDNYVTLPDVVFQMSTPLTRNVLELFVFHSTTISRRQRPPRRRVPIPVEARVQMTAVTRYPVATAAGAPAGS